MITEDDLRAALATAHVHCRPGGVAVIVPDDTRETFAPSTDSGGGDGADGRAARLFSWSWADPAGTSTTTVYAFVLRDTDGRVRVFYETHRCGLFGRDQWLRLLAEVGFTPEVVTEATTEDRPPRQIFVGHRHA